MRLSQLSDRQIERYGLDRFEARALARLGQLYWSPEQGLITPNDRWLSSSVEQASLIKAPRFSEEELADRLVKVELQRRHGLHRISARERPAGHFQVTGNFRRDVVLGIDHGVQMPVVARVVRMVRDENGLRVDMVFEAEPSVDVGGVRTA